MKSIVIPVKNIDFKLLRKQKAALIKVTYKNSTTPKKSILLEGIIALMDSIQDDAKIILGSKKVFGKRK